MPKEAAGERGDVTSSDEDEEGGGVVAVLQLALMYHIALVKNRVDCKSISIGRLFFLMWSFVT